MIACNARFVRFARSIIILGTCSGLLLSCGARSSAQDEQREASSGSARQIIVTPAMPDPVVLTREEQACGLKLVDNYRFGPPVLVAGNDTGKALQCLRDVGSSYADVETIHYMRSAMDRGQQCAALDQLEALLHDRGGDVRTASDVAAWADEYEELFDGFFERDLRTLFANPERCQTVDPKHVDTINLLRAELTRRLERGQAEIRARLARERASGKPNVNDSSSKETQRD